MHAVQLRVGDNSNWMFEEYSDHVLGDLVSDRGLHFQLDQLWWAHNKYHRKYILQLLYVQYEGKAEKSGCWNEQRKTTFSSEQWQMRWTVDRKSMDEVLRSYMKVTWKWKRDWKIPKIFNNLYVKKWKKYTKSKIKRLFWTYDDTVLDKTRLFWVVVTRNSSTQHDHLPRFSQKLFLDKVQKQIVRKKTPVQCYLFCLTETNTQIQIIKCTIKCIIFKPNNK